MSTPVRLTDRSLVDHHIYPSPVVAFDAPASADRDGAWDAFIAAHTPLLVRVARAVCRDPDDAMDAYTYVLERLREHDFARLRGYRAGPGCAFDTWLAVVSRRLCVDHLRHKYGRDRGHDEQAHAGRRRLADLMAASVDVDLLPGDGDATLVLERAEMLRALEDRLAALDPADRLLLRYRFDDDISAAEIARLMNYRSIFHVYRRVNALLSILKRALQAKGFSRGDV